MSTPRWTITALTIPGREHYLRQLIQSIEATVIPGGARLVIVYNRAIRDDLADVERSIRSWSTASRSRCTSTTGTRRSAAAETTSSTW